MAQLGLAVTNHTEPCLNIYLTTTQSIVCLFILKFVFCQGDAMSGVTVEPSNGTLEPGDSLTLTLL